MQDNASVALVQEELRSVDSQLVASRGKETSKALSGQGEDMPRSAATETGREEAGREREERSSVSHGRSSSSSSSSSASPPQRPLSSPSAAACEEEGKQDAESSLVEAALSTLGGVHSKQSLRRIIATTIASAAGKLSQTSSPALVGKAIEATLCSKIAQGELALL